MEPVEVGKHLIVDPQVCHGQLTFQGTRVPVSTVLLYLAKGLTIEQILESWPELQREAVAEAIRLAAAALVERSTGKARAAKGKPREAADQTALAAQQDAGPVKSFDNLLVDSWTEQDSADHPVLHVVKHWRRGGNDGSQP